MVIGIDIGGSSIRVGAFDGLDGAKLVKFKKDQISDNYERDLEKLKELIYEISESKVEGIGVGIAGVWDEQSGKLTESPNLQHWVGKMFKKTLSEEFNAPVKVVNDAVAAALGEAMFGQYHGKEFLNLIWGTGIGGAIIQKRGDIYPLVTHFEPGHETLHANGLLCRCGEHGCLEAYCGGAALESRFGKQPEELSDQEWSTVLDDLSLGLANVLAIYNLQLVIFGGGIAIKQAQRIPTLQKLLSQKIKPSPELRVSSMGEKAGVYGAISLLFNKQN